MEEDSVALEQTLTDISICTRCSCSAGVFGDAHSLGVMLVDGEMRRKGFRRAIDEFSRRQGATVYDGINSSIKRFSWGVPPRSVEETFDLSDQDFQIWRTLISKW